MALTYKILGQASPATTTAVDLYTVGAGKSAVISTLSITNLSAAAVTARVYIRAGGAASSTANALVYDASFAANSVTALTVGITLSATDVITVQSNTGTALTFMAFGQENS